MRVEIEAEVVKLNYMNFPIAS